MGTILDNTAKLSNKWITLAIGCLQSVSSGPAYAIAASTRDIRSTFHMTENQYGLVATLYLMGTFFMFLPGIVLDNYGPVPVSVISLILTVFSHGSIWQLAKYDPFPAQEYYLYVAFFCAGLSAAGQGTVALTINIGNFQKSAHGKVSGALGFFIYIGAAIFTQLYSDLFIGNLSDYFLLVTIYTGIVCLLMVLFVRRFHDENGYDAMESDECNDRNHYKINTHPLKTPEYYIIFVSRLFIICAAQVLLFMVASYTESLGLEGYATGLLTMSSVVSAASMLGIGTLSDFVIKKFPRMSIALVLTIANVLALLLAIFQINHIQVFVLLMLTNAVLFPINDTLIPSELHECFGDAHFGKVLGVIATSMGFATMGLEYFATWFYENETRKQDSPDEWCHGKICTLPGLLMMVILDMIAIVLILVYLHRRKNSIGNI